MSEIAVENSVMRLIGIGEKDIEMALQRLDRLTLEASWMIAAQTLEVVHGLHERKRETLEGAYSLLVSLRSLYQMPLLVRWTGIKRVHRGGSRCVWLACMSE